MTSIPIEYASLHVVLFGVLGYLYWQAYRLLFGWLLPMWQEALERILRALGD